MDEGCGCVLALVVIAAIVIFGGGYVKKNYTNKHISVTIGETDQEPPVKKPWKSIFKKAEAEPETATIEREPKLETKKPAPKPVKPEFAHQLAIFPLIPFFVIGSIPFWILLVIFVGSLFYFAKTDRWASSFFATLGFLAFLYIFGNFDVVTWLVKNVIYIIPGIVAYILCGLGWGTFRWKMFLNENGHNMLESRDEWYQPRKKDFLNKDQDYIRKAWEKYYKDIEKNAYSKVDGINRLGFEPEPKIKAPNHRHEMITWVELWIMDIFIWVGEDFLRNIGNWIYHTFAGYWQRMSDRTWAKVNNREFPQD